MAQTSLPAHWKYCATCAKWGGSRQYDAIPGNVIFESAGRGECNDNDGAASRPQRGARDTCPRWAPHL
jgi:hypothetical protein